MKRTYVNRLPKNEEVKNTNVRVENGELIVEVEFEEKFEPKDGDFVTYECREKATFVYKKGMYNDFCGCYWGEKADARHLGKNKDSLYTRKSDCWESKFYCRYATEEEKSALLERLEKECHKRWNPETKKLEDIRWRAERRERYYFVTSACDVATYEESNIGCDYVYYNLGNYFRTQEAAQKVADQIKEIFKNSKG